MADLKRLDAIMAELVKAPEMRAVGAMITNSENKGERDAIVKRLRNKLTEYLMETYYPKENE